MHGNLINKNKNKLFLTANSDLAGRITILENNVYKVTYYEIISGATGTLTVPTGATINTGEFSGANCILSEIDGSNKVTWVSPETAGGTVVTATLNTSTGAWVKSGVTVSANVALIYSINITGLNYANLNNFYIIDETNVSISGGINVNEIAYGSAEDTIKGSVLLTFDGTTLTSSSNTVFGTASGSNTHIFNVGSSTAQFIFREKIGATTTGAMYLGVASGSESSTNYAINWDGTMRINSQTSTSALALLVGGNSAFTITPANTGSTAYFSFATRSRTTLTTTANIPTFEVSGNTQTWASGTVALQYFNYFRSQTMGFASASTATFVAGLTVELPTRGTNATFGTAVGIYVPTIAYTSTTTAYGAYFEAPSGATSNYALGVTGPILSSGSDGANSMLFRSGANNRGHIKPTSGTITFQISSLNSIPLALAVDGTTYLSLTSTDLTFSNAVNMIFNTSTGTKIGTGTTQKLSFWNATPIVQPTTAVAAATLVGGGGTTITDTDTFDGYTLKQIVKALRNTGLLA